MKLREIIQEKNTVNEAFTTKLFWILGFENEEEKVYATSVPEDGSYLELGYTDNNDSDFSDVSVQFTRKGELGITNEGLAITIFGAVINHIMGFIKEHNTRRLVFSAHKPLGNFGVPDETRSMLYKKMLDRYTKKLGWSYKVETSDTTDRFIVTKNVNENFKDGKKPGRKGLAKRMGINTKASISSLRKTAKKSSGEKQRMAHWLANMKSGRKKKKESTYIDDAILEYEDVDIEQIHANNLKEYLLSNPELYENNTEYDKFQNFLDKNKSLRPEVNKKYFYIIIQTIPISKVMSIAYFKNDHEIFELDKNHAYFKIDNKIKRFPIEGSLTGDALSGIYFFESKSSFDKFQTLIELTFSEYKKIYKILDLEKNKTNEEANKFIDVIDNKSGWGAVPDNQEVDYKGLRVKMKPSVFLKLAAPLDSEPATEIIDHIKNDGKIGSPFLLIKYPYEWEDDDFSLPASVMGHDGRNRMKTILKLYGDQPIETHLFFLGGVRNRDLTKNIINNLKSQMSPELSNKILSGPLFENSINETATAGATSAGSIASLPNPTAAKTKVKKRGKYGAPEAPQQKNKDGTVKNALDTNSSLMGGKPIKR